MRVETCLPGFVERRVPERPEWVEANQRDPRTAAEVYTKFALGFSTLFFALFAVGLFNAAVLLFVPLVAANAYAWTRLLWWLRIPQDATVSRRRTITTGLAIGTLSWLTVGPLMVAATVAVGRLVGGQYYQTVEPVAAVLGFGTFMSIAGLVFTLGVPTIASVGLALWTLDYEERNGREKRKANFDFE